MIFIAKADGTLEKVFPEAVHQGSVGVNKLILVAPFVAGTAVTAACKLPNGIYTKPTLLRTATVSSLSTEYGESYNAWEFTLDAAVTQYSGAVTVQFFVNGQGTVLATYADTFTVAKGVPQELPDTPSADVYNDILDALSGVGVRLTAAENTIVSNTKRIGAHENSIDTNSAEISQLQAMRIEETELESGDKEYSLVFYDKNEGGVASHGATFTIPLSRISALEGDVETAEKDIEDLKAYDETSKGKFAVLETAKIKKGTDGNGDPVYSFVWTEDGAEERQGEEITIPIKRIKAVEDKVNGLSILTNVSFNSSTEKLYFTFSSGNTVEIDISEFVDVNELADRINNELGASVVANAEAAVKPYRDEAQAFSVSAQKQAGYSQQYASDASARAEAARKYAERAETAKAGAETAKNESFSGASAASSLAGMAATSASEAAEYASQAKASASVASDAASRISVFDKRLQNLENGISPDPFYTDYTVAYQKDVPARALPFAALERLGGMSYKSKNLFNGVLERGYYDANGGYISSSAGYISDYIRIDGKIVTFSAVLTKTGDALRLTSFDGNKNFLERVLSSGTSEPMTYNNPNAVYVRICVFAGQYDQKTMQLEYGPNATEYAPYFEGIRHAAVTEIESEGKNLYDANFATFTGAGVTYSTDGVYVTMNGTRQVGNALQVVGRPNITLQPGTYTISAKMIGGTITRANPSSTDDGVYFGINKSTYGYRTANNLVKVGDVASRTFQITEPLEVTSFELAPGYSSANGSVFNNVVVACQFEKADAMTDFEPYIKETFSIPEGYRSLYGYGLGISEDVHNYIDLSLNKYKQMCSIRAYQSGDENNPEVITDGTNTVYPLSSPVETDIAPIDNYIRVGGGGTLTFVNEHSMAVPSTVSYLMKEASV